MRWLTKKFSMIFSTDETELTEKKVDHVGNKTKLCTITVALGRMQWTQATAAAVGEISIFGNCPKICINFKAAPTTTHFLLKAKWVAIPFLEQRWCANFQCHLYTYDAVIMTSICTLILHLEFWISLKS